MLQWNFDPLRPLWSMLRAHSSPSQLASGFAIGVVIGLAPLGSLVATILCVLLFSLRVNRATGCIAALLFMWTTPWIDPYAHIVGLHALSIQSLQSTYAWLYDMPLGPWIGFNNTVALGGLLIGVYFSFPIYWLSYTFFSRLLGWRENRRRRQEVASLMARMNIGAEWGAAA